MNISKSNKQITSDILLNSGVYMKVDFKQMLKKIETIDENTPYIEGYKYTPSYSWNNIIVPDNIQNIRIVGSRKDNRSITQIKYITNNGEEVEVDEIFWSNDIKDKDGVYVLSPEGEARMKEENEVMNASIDSKSRMSKLPVEMVNMILSNNNPVYVNKKRKPLTNISKKGGKYYKKSTRRNKNKKNKKSKKNTKKSKKIRLIRRSKK